MFKCETKGETQVVGKVEKQASKTFFPLNDKGEEEVIAATFNTNNTELNKKNLSRHQLASNEKKHYPLYRNPYAPTQESFGPAKSTDRDHITC